MPGPLFTAGADLYLTGRLRLIGGVLVGAKEFTIKGIYRGIANIGGQLYSSTELGQLLGQITSSNAAPYAGIGFGKTGSGAGISLEIGAAFLGEPDLALRVNGGVCSQNAQCNAQLQANLNRESLEVLDEFKKYAKIYPMISLGLHFGFGAR